MYHRVLNNNSVKEISGSIQKGTEKNTLRAIADTEGGTTVRQSRGVHYMEVVSSEYINMRNSDKKLCEYK